VSGPEDPANGTMRFAIKEAILENRSSKNVQSVTVRWLVTPMVDEGNVLLRGDMEPHKLELLHKTLLAGHRQTLKLSTPNILQMLRDLPKAALYETRYTLLIGVSKIVFEGGSTWSDGASVN
jgi:hypothetical protein